MTLTPFQEQCLTIIENELKANTAYAAWMKPSYIMALIQEESNWNKDIPSSDGLGSIGLMQPLPETVAAAKAGGVQAGSMHDPQSNIRVGLFCFEGKRKYLHAHEFTPNSHGLKLGRPVKLEDVVAAYNEGEGNVLKGRADQPYVDRFHRYQAMFSFVDLVMVGHPVIATALNGDKPPPVEPAPVADPVVVREAPSSAAEAVSWWPHLDWHVFFASVLAASPPAPSAVPVDGQAAAASATPPPPSPPSEDSPVVAAAKAAVAASRKTKGK